MVRPCVAPERAEAFSGVLRLVGLELWHAWPSMALNVECHGVLPTAGCFAALRLERMELSAEIDATPWQPASGAWNSEHWLDTSSCLLVTDGVEKGLVIFGEQ
jgi:hypothetical protein